MNIYEYNIGKSTIELWAIFYVANWNKLPEAITWESSSNRLPRMLTSSTEKCHVECLDHWIAMFLQCISILIGIIFPICGCLNRSPRFQSCIHLYIQYICTIYIYIHNINIYIQYIYIYNIYLYIQYISIYTIYIYTIYIYNIYNII